MLDTVTPNGSGPEDPQDQELRDRLGVQTEELAKIIAEDYQKNLRRDDDWSRAPDTKSVKGDFTDWMNLISSGIRPVIYALDEFLDYADLINPNKEVLILSLLELARKQLRARGSNSTLVLQGMAIEVKMLTEMHAIAAGGGEVDVSEFAHEESYGALAFMAPWFRQPGVPCLEDRGHQGRDAPDHQPGGQGQAPGRVLGLRAPAQGAERAGIRPRPGRHHPLAPLFRGGVHRPGESQRARPGPGPHPGGPRPPTRSPDPTDHVRGRGQGGREGRAEGVHGCAYMTTQKTRKPHAKNDVLLVVRPDMDLAVTNDLEKGAVGFDVPEWRHAYPSDMEPVPVYRWARVGQEPFHHRSVYCVIDDPIPPEDDIEYLHEGLVTEYEHAMAGEGKDQVKEKKGKRLMNFIALGIGAAFLAAVMLYIAVLKADPVIQVEMVTSQEVASETAAP